jgi:hypothetical protein
VREAGRRSDPADLPAARQRTIAMLGREQAGIPVEALDLLGVWVGIPTIGTAASLNAAVEGSLVLNRLGGSLTATAAGPLSRHGTSRRRNGIGSARTAADAGIHPEGGDA